ncbi:MAG TPA: hemin uptake protein HemP [Pseudolabrys sp.]|nr:hemin uptake protein HemP [Pseudolabrys sp.]
MPNGANESGPETMQRDTRTPRTISSRKLLGGGKLIVIRHEGEDYRLQLTAAGKLILTK